MLRSGTAMGREPIARLCHGIFGVTLAVGAGACGSYDPDAVTLKADLRINEVVSDNEGVWLDERGETDDYVELYNASPRTLRLSDYLIVDRSGEHTLPNVTLQSGGTLLLCQEGHLTEIVPFAKDSKNLLMPGLISHRGL